MNYQQAEYLKRLISDNYRVMSNEDYENIKSLIQKVASKKIDDVVRKALGK